MKNAKAMKIVLFTISIVFTILLFFLSNVELLYAHAQEFSETLEFENTCSTVDLHGQDFCDERS